ncbi:hypothetical protein G3N30_14995 [Microbacterium lacticum]|uniref:hypothetical protein n=1 Tax=Microbacterium lacticum TaxID=33885 RepID=UPI0018B023B3|nr:hypothetical protein [Microbacterium lacticum]MBF9337467.1 hypothetical protein [Microbacterium lacticum]
MWIFEAIWGGYPDIPALAREVFRVFCGLALVWKFSWDMRWGGYRYFDHRSLTRWRYEGLKRHLKLIPSPRAYRVFYVARYVCAWFILLGIWSQYSAVIVALWCAFEFTFDRKFHTQYLLLGTLFLALTPGDTCFGLLSTGGWDSCLYSSTYSAPAVLMIFAICVMYIGSVVTKLKSPQFLSGDVLYLTYSHYAHISSQMQYRETFYPRPLLKYFVWVDGDRGRRRWRVLSLVALVLEIATPILLLFTTTWVIGAILGIIMHGGFWLLFPKRLLPFSLAVVGAYPIFIAPATMLSLASGLIG